LDDLPVIASYTFPFSGNIRHRYPNGYPANGQPSWTMVALRVTPGNWPSRVLTRTLSPLCQLPASHPPGHATKEFGLSGLNGHPHKALI
jgi:hypothetical protein